MRRCSQGTYKDSQTDEIPWRFPSHRWDANQDKVCYNKYPTETIKKGVTCTCNNNNGKT